MYSLAITSNEMLWVDPVPKSGGDCGLELESDGGELLT